MYDLNFVWLGPEGTSPLVYDLGVVYDFVPCMTFLLYPSYIVCMTVHIYVYTIYPYKGMSVIKF